MKNIEVFTVRFDSLSTEQQATFILDKVNQLHQQGHATIGITYSANQEQTERIKKTYAQKQWKTNTSGANQAAVIARIETLLKKETYAHLQGVFRIVPITTMDYRNKNSTAKDEDVQDSLNDASQFITTGGYLLGWANQLTPKGTLAIGGGVAAQSQTVAQKKMIQSWVSNTFFQTPSSSSTITDTTPVKVTPPVKENSQKAPAKNVLDDELVLAQRKKALKQKIDPIFTQLEKDISTIDAAYYEEAKNTADALIRELQQAKLNYFTALNEVHAINLRTAVERLKVPTENFYNECETLITNAKPVLSKDLGWGDYLLNVLKAVSNAVIWLTTLGYVNDFFKPAQSKLLTVVEEAEQAMIGSRSTL